LNEEFDESELIAEILRREELENSSPKVSFVPLLKQARERLIPKVIRRLEKESIGDSLLEEARGWLKDRSSGYSGRVALPKEEIERRKKEAGYIVQRFNRIYSNGNLIE